MSNPIDGPRAKLIRGLEHVAALKAEYLSTFGADGPVRVGVEQHYDPDAQAWVVTLHDVPEPSARLGLIAGDAVHNFRAALDHLILVLAILDSGVEPKGGRTQFPITSSRAAFNEKGLQTRLLEGVAPHHVAVIERHQPFHAAEDDPGALHPLSVLNDLDNDDKHRTIQPAFVAAEDFGMRVPSRGENCESTGAMSGTTPLGGPLQSGTEVLRLPLRITGPDPKMDVQCRASLKLVLRNGLPLIEALEVIAGYVAEVLQEFAAELDSDEAVARWTAVEGRFGQFQDLAAHRVTVTAVHERNCQMLWTEWE